MKNHGGIIYHGKNMGCIMKLSWEYFSIVESNGVSLHQIFQQ
jgi:hypothetical protein